MLLSEKVCIITGAASPRGIGRATARIFAKHGGRTVILDLDEKQAKAAAADMGAEHRGLRCDVTDKGACLTAIDQVIRDFGRVDVLINNAGITQPLKIMEIEPKNYDAVLDVNLYGQKVYPAAEVLRRRSVPFVFSTGYSLAGIDPEWATYPVVQKPFLVERLAQALAQALPGSGPCRG